eukprot:m.261085 g.261085  ORF g.261085 m.261085 type:complete len:151 (-) comp19221_c0_seq3:64-516(-)
MLTQKLAAEGSGSPFKHVLQLKTELVGHPSWLRSCCFSQDGRIAVTGCDTRLCLWNAETGGLLRAAACRSDVLLQCTVSDDGRLLTVGATNLLARRQLTTSRPQTAPGNTSIDNAATTDSCSRPSRQARATTAVRAAAAARRYLQSPLPD